MEELTKKKVHEMTRSLQKKAAEMDAALTRQEERREFAKMVAEDRARQDAKKRTFANPQNADEAEGTLPTLEELYNGKNLPSKEQLDTGEDIFLSSPSSGWKTKSEILEDGTLIQKLKIYFVSGDMDSYFQSKGKLTKEEVAKIAASIRTDEDKDLLRKCYKEYHALKEFGRQLSYFFKRFQVSFSLLSQLINKWESYEQRAAEYTRLYNSTKSHVSSLTDEAFTAAVLKNVVKDCTREAMFDGATLYFDEATTSFKVKVDGEGGLYEEIKREAEATARDLSEFKAYAVAAEEYIATSILLYMPISIQMSIENAEEERYTRYLVKNLSYFRSELNIKKEKGETITPEEEAKAVIPDYYEVEPSKMVYKDAKKWLKNL